MGKAIWTSILFTISILGCGNVEETLPTETVAVAIEAALPAVIEEATPSLPVTETWVDSLVIDSNHLVYILKKEAGNFGEPGWISNLSLIVKSSTENNRKFIATTDGGFQGVQYIEKSLAKISIAGKTHVVFFYEIYVDGLDPDKLVLISTDLDDVTSYGCSYFKEDKALVCDLIYEKELELYAEPIQKAYEQDKNSKY